MTFNLQGFRTTPLELKRFLDQYIIGQDHAKETLANSVCGHYIQLKGQSLKSSDHFSSTVKSTPLLIGPTGSGKTRLVTLVASYLGLPHVNFDATTFTPMGFYGQDAENIPRLLFKEAQGNKELCEMGIVYIDEVDKIASGRNLNPEGREVPHKATQQSMLKVIEGIQVELNPPHLPPLLPQIKIDTTHMLFILTGAFEGLEEIIDKRLGTYKVGFTSSDIKAAESREPTIKDLMKYGFDEQFLGRISAVAVLDRLSESQLYNILKLPTCQFTNSQSEKFAGYGINLQFDDDALVELAHQAAALNIGGRGLQRVVDTLLTPFFFYLPSTSLKDLVVTAEMILNPRETLERLLESYPLREDKGALTIVHSTSSINPSLGPQNGTRVRLSEPAYVMELAKHAVPADYVPIAAKYGLAKDIEPQNIPEIISLFTSQIDDYINQFEAQHNVRLNFDSEVRTSIVKDVLGRSGRDEVSEVIEFKFGTYIRDKKILMRYVGQQLDIPYRAVVETRDFFRSLLDPKTN